MSTQPENNPKFSFHSSAESSLKDSVERTMFLEETDLQDLTFKFTYWDLASVGSTSRDLLVFAKAHHKVRYEFHTPTDSDWDNGKVFTGFSYLPVMKISGPQGKVM
jgi:hypothetical protein